MSSILDPALAAKVAQARHRAEHRVAVLPPARTEDPTVLLSVRVPASLRAQVHEAARVAGAASTQAWLSAAVANAVAQVLTPEGRAAAVLLEEVQRHLGQALDDGTYAALVAEMDDPELG